jgi:hypothetical protein
MGRPSRAFALILMLAVLAGMGPCRQSVPDLEPPPVTPNPQEPIIPGPPVD